MEKCSLKELLAEADFCEPYKDEEGYHTYYWVDGDLGTVGISAKTFEEFIEKCELDLEDLGITIEEIEDDLRFWSVGDQEEV